MKDIKSRISSLNFISFILFLFSISFNDRLLIYVFDFWILTSFIDILLNKRWKHLGKERNNAIFWIYILLFSYSSFTLFYSQDIYSGWLIAERQLAILIIPVIGIFGLYNNYDIGSSLKALINGLIICSALIIIIMFYQVIITDSSRGSFLFSRARYIQETIGIFRHRSYFGLLGSFVLISIYYLLKTGKLNSLEKKTYLLGSLLIVTVIFISQARISIISIIILAMLILLVEARNLHRWYFLAILISLFIIAGLSIFFIPRYSEIFSFKDHSGQAVTLAESRYFIWKYCLHALRGKWFFGLGLGDVQNVLNNEYIENKFTQGIDYHLNAHNQFLQAVLEGGGMECILLFACLFFIFKHTAKCNFGKLLAVALIFSLLGEVILHRYLGVILFTLSPIFLNLSNYRLESFRSGSLSRLFCFGLIIISCFSLVFLLILFTGKTHIDPGNPKTYASQPYFLIFKDDLPPLLQSEVRGFKLDSTYYLTNNNGSGHAYMIIFSKHFTSNINIKASIYCNISKNFRKGKVAFAIGGPGLGYKTAYPRMELRDTWQQLKVEKSFQPGTIRAIIDIQEVSTDSVLSGSISFAYPIIVDN
jgi:O-antigen ligase